MKMEQSVPKRRHIKFRRRGIAQKKAYNNRCGNYSQNYLGLSIYYIVSVVLHADTYRSIVDGSYMIS